MPCELHKKLINEHRYVEVAVNPVSARGDVDQRGCSKVEHSSEFCLGLLTKTQNMDKLYENRNAPVIKAPNSFKNNKKKGRKIAPRKIART
ncbi:hypothetical protein HCH_01210 [Hahella chejuensis KCTC 2396]|uniref:Uncharacterized protein n=1 Tax=Hahella chejuensis (strain KCTC 2396) TaxID=349521 RepID=Q2SMP1_HAHCH|nr:hypothetical protein HCH_01210 [Hahella chejuensis KCTC 2396]